MKFNYDLAISFAGEDRKHARHIADRLGENGLNIFFDEYFRGDLWGKDLYRHLSRVYTSEAKYCLILVSKSYESKLWTNHELRSAQARALNEKTKEYILPLLIDDTKLDGLLSTIGYLDLRDFTYDEIVSYLLEKIGYKSIKEQNESHYTLDYINIISGSTVLPTATVQLSIGDKSVIESAIGNGTIDACYNAIAKITKTKSILKSFKVKSINTLESVNWEDGPQGVVTVTLEENNIMVSGYGADYHDIIIMAAKAYIDGLNKLHISNTRKTRIEQFA
jgi:hypothetical protein